MGRTILHEAAAKGNAAVVNTLGEMEFNVDTIEKEGNTPIHIAAASGQLHAFQVLLKKKKENLDSEEVQVLLRLAADKGFYHIVDALSHEVNFD